MRHAPPRPPRQKTIMWRWLVAAISLFGVHTHVCRAGAEALDLRVKELQFRGNSGLEDNLGLGKQFSGYFRLNRTYSAEMFFFMFERRLEAASAPVVLWMTGTWFSQTWTVDPSLALPLSHSPRAGSHARSFARWPRLFVRARGVLRKRALEPPPRRSGRDRSGRDQVRVGQCRHDDIRRSTSEHRIFVQRK